MNIEKIYKDDQRERVSDVWTKEKDLRHRKLALKILFRPSHIFSGSEWFYLGQIFHHGSTIFESFVALTSSLVSFIFGYFQARNLFALSINRLCMKSKIPQVFGSQLYRKNNNNSRWTVYRSIDISDHLRKLFLCETKSEVEERVRKMNYS
jgi:hypothetical protein